MKIIYIYPIILLLASCITKSVVKEVEVSNDMPNLQHQYAHKDSFIQLVSCFERKAVSIDEWKKEALKLKRLTKIEQIPYGENDPKYDMNVVVPKWIESDAVYLCEFHGYKEGTTYSVLVFFKNSKTIKVIWKTMDGYGLNRMARD
jgi:hypothetical protein